MEPILTIDNLNSFGGNMLRQGDKSQLKYRLRDVGNKNLGISGKSCEITMYGRNYTTIVYETTSTVSSDNTVSFTIDKVLPKGTFYLEFTVGDYIFPTDHKEFFEITPSGKGIEANIIEIVGVDAVANKVIERIGDNIGEVVNADEVASVIERDSLLDGKVTPKDDSVTNKKLTTGSTTLSKINIDGYLPMTLEYESESLSNTRMYSVVYLKVGDIIKLNGDFQVSITRVNEPDDSYGSSNEGRKAWSYEDYIVPEESWYYIRVRFESNASILGDDLDNLINRGVLILTSDTAVTKKELNEALSDLPTEVPPQKLSQSGDIITLSGDGGTIDLSNKQDKLTDGDITTSLISSKSVTLDKLDIDGYLPVPFEAHLLSFPPYNDSLTANSRASAHFDVIEKGWEINVLNDDISISIFEYNESTDGYTAQLSWRKSHVTEKEYNNATIVFKKDSGLVFKKEDLEQLPNWVEIITEDTAVKRKEFLPVKAQIDDISANMDPDNFKLSDLGRRNENIIFNGLGNESMADTASYSDAYINNNAMMNTDIVNKQIVIKPEGYWFIRLNPEAFVNESKLTVRFNMLQGFSYPTHSVRLVDADGRNNYTYMQTSDDRELSVDLPDGIETYQRIEIRFDNRTGTEDVVLEYLLANTYDNVNLINLGMSLVKPSGAGGLGTKYVSLTGSDINSGDSMSDGYATLQKALQELNGVGTIIVERGIYYGQSVNYKAKDIKILAHTEDYDGSLQDRQLAEFRGSDTLTGWEASGDVYRLPYSGNSRFDKVFVSKELPPETTSSRPSYNAVLWEGNDGVIDYKMKPVLTLAECQAEVGTFFYDGTHLYINPNDVSNEFNAVKTDVGFVLSGDNVTLQDIVFDFYTSVPMRLFKIKNLIAQNCEANHSSTGNGFGFDYTNATMTNCRANKNRNDGFNMHFYGDTTLINCKGINNYDDGVSHHEDCTGTIIGGEYSGNVKGGIIPVNGSTIQVYGAVIENNRFGFYTESPNALSHGNFYKDNQEAIVNLADTPIRSINDVFVNNANREGNLTLYNETVINN